MQRARAELRLGRTANELHSAQDGTHRSPHPSRPCSRPRPSPLGSLLVSALSHSLRAIASGQTILVALLRPTLALRICEHSLSLLLSQRGPLVWARCSLERFSGSPGAAFFDPLEEERTAENRALDRRSRQRRAGLSVRIGHTRSLEFTLLL